MNKTLLQRIVEESFARESETLLKNARETIAALSEDNTETKDETRENCHE